MYESFSEIIFWCGYCERYLFFDTTQKAVVVNDSFSKYMCVRCHAMEQLELNLKNKKNEK